MRRNSQSSLKQNSIKTCYKIIGVRVHVAQWWGPEFRIPCMKPAPYKCLYVIFKGFSTLSWSQFRKALTYIYRVMHVYVCACIVFVHTHNTHSHVRAHTHKNKSFHQWVKRGILVLHTTPLPYGRQGFIYSIWQSHSACSHLLRVCKTIESATLNGMHL